MTDTAMAEARGYVAVNIIRFRDGTEIRIDDIATPEQGRIILDDVDASILAIEDQIEHMDLSTQNDVDWKRRAERALKVKRRSRPRLQAHIGLLMREEKARQHKDTMAQGSVVVDAKRKMFVRAAYDMLGHEACTEVWVRAAEMAPDVFPNGAEDGRP